MNPFKLRRFNEVSVIADDDRISKLPNKLIGHILSFLPTRCAVATSVLSKRWRHAWFDISVLDFTDLPSTITSRLERTVFSQAQRVSFTNFVNRVLLLNSAPCLERVYLETYDQFEAPRIFEWMSAIARRCVQELCFIVRGYRIGMSPSFLLANKKLVVLKLQGIKFYLPSSFQLPCLRSLSLIKVEFQNECDSMTNSDPWNRFLSSCPVLEELNLDYCEASEGLKKLSVCSSSIKILRIAFDKEPKRAINIETPNLEVLHLDMAIIQSKVNVLPSLVQTRLDIWTSSVRWIKLLQRISYTQTLVLYQIALDGSTTFIRLPIFQNLTHMEVGFTSWSIVFQIIRNAPKLVSFIIHKLMFDWADSKPRKKELPLKRIEYYSVDEDEDFEVVAYFLSNCALLKEFKIYTHRWVDSRAEVEILKKLMNLPRASNQCKVTLVNENCYSESEDSDCESSESCSLEDEDSL